MTAPTLGPDDVRRLLSEARAIVAAIDAIATDAPDGQTRDFGRHLSALAHRHWNDLLGCVARADADMFDRLLQPLYALTVPLGDAPEAGRPAATEAGNRMSVLAADVGETFDPLLTPDKELPEPVLAQIAAALREVGPEFA
jgi:hypothetical protein